jgi:integrase
MTSKQLSSSPSPSPSQAYHNFVETCRSPYTRTQYIKALRYFMDYRKLQPAHDYDGLLPPQRDSKTIQMDLCDFVTYLRQKGLASASVTLYIAALTKFYSINDVVVNWRRVKSFMAEHERRAEDRPYTHSELLTLVNAASIRNRAIILLMASAGLRAGALPLLRIRDLQPIDKYNYNIYRIDVYAKSKRHSYFTFCTPECRAALDQYLEWRKRSNERLADDTILFRREYDPNTNKQPIAPMPISMRAIEKVLKILLLETGLRDPPIEGQRHVRKTVMMTHGCRKFFQTNAFKAGMDREYIRRLMGHKGGQSVLDDAYNKISEEELLEGDSKHVGFVGIIDQLTIDEANKLRREVETLRVEKSSLEAMRKELDDIKELLKQG